MDSTSACLLPDRTACPKAFGAEIWTAGLGIRALARYVKVEGP
jgi:hypothetical protein